MRYLLNFIICLLLTGHLCGRELRPTIPAPHQGTSRQSVHFDTGRPFIPSPVTRKYSKKRIWHRKKNTVLKTAKKEKAGLKVHPGLFKEIAVLQQQLMAGPSEPGQNHKQLEQIVSKKVTRLLPTGRYSFEEKCSLVFHPNLQVKNRPYFVFVPACSSKKIRIRLRKDKSRLLQLLASADQPLLLKANLQLEKVRLGKRDLYWRWKLLQMEFSNPFLQLVFTERQSQKWSALKKPVSKASELAKVLSLFARLRQFIPDDELVTRLHQVLPATTGVLFDKHCPLQLISEPQSLAGGMARLEFQAACLPKPWARLRVHLAVSDHKFRFFIGKHSQQRLLATLQFRRIVTTRDQFYLLWDTILNTEILQDAGF